MRAKISKGMGIKFAEHVGIKESEDQDAFVYITEYRDNRDLKYRMQAREITLENIKNFIKEFREGRLEEFKRS